MAHQLKPLQCGLSILALEEEKVKEFLGLFLAFSPVFCYTCWASSLNGQMYVSNASKGGFFVKTKYWIALLSVILLVCALLSIWVLAPGESADYAEIRSQGKLLKTVSLHTDQTFTVETPEGGQNTITVTDGRIAVTSANCPDHYCMQRGFCSSGTPIVCLPNQLVIQFNGQQELDAAVG